MGFTEPRFGLDSPKLQFFLLLGLASIIRFFLGLAMGWKLTGVKQMSFGACVVSVSAERQSVPPPNSDHHPL